MRASFLCPLGNGPEQAMKIESFTTAITPTNITARTLPTKKTTPAKTSNDAH
jgi:hypothetical protein